jgi:transcriptional regulator with GAF, ATPase, and Fis domain
MGSLECYWPCKESEAPKPHHSYSLAFRIQYIGNHFGAGLLSLNEVMTKAEAKPTPVAKPCDAFAHCQSNTVSFPSDEILGDCQAFASARCRQRSVVALPKRSFFAASTSSFRQGECGVILQALRAVSGRIAGKGGAAERLALKRTTLQNTIRRLGMTKAHYQN